ncbi:transcriptional regulator [Falsochrobactrum shanghaiense]|uniref:Transcriptional regulator n=1 Tax=Falsochrobactrum shanghaiense TaxID=2201899 RepID=A0A316J4Z7_9HYPH|nr:transcriptional regulator [Falsochrobactrum shanghaiense]PWL16238.1 transcriptional regulator [Falsochrobactrum shanghaiense]
MAQSYNNRKSLFVDRKILVFEALFLLSQEAQNKLVKMGATVLGPVNTIQGALDFLERANIDGVIIDISLDINQVLPLITKLDDISVPFIFAFSNNPHLDTTDFSGFVLSNRESDLTTIAEALFLCSNMDH